MEEQYVIKGSTLDNTADAIREMTHTSEDINPLDFPNKILAIEPTTEEYMRIVDYMHYPNFVHEPDYAPGEVARVDSILQFYEHHHNKEFILIPKLELAVGNNFYIPIGIIPTHLMVECDIKLADTSANTNVFGTQASMSGDYFHLTTYNQRWYWGLNNSEVSGGWIDTAEHDIIFNDYNNNVIINGLIIGSSANTTSTEPLDLFRRELWGDNIYYHGTVYFIKITDKQTRTVIHDFRPAKKRSDGSLGLYDLINEQFYEYNGGDTNG